METNTNTMTDLESMQYHCDTWNIMYLNDKPSQDIIGIDLPFDVIKKYGKLFTSEQSAELKSDEELLLKKAITRIGDFKSYIDSKSENESENENTKSQELRLSVPTKVFHYEKSDKLKLYHGLVKYSFTMGTHELTWITINDKVIDFHNYNGTNNNGNIEKGTLYYGVEIPREITKEVIMNSGISVEIKHPKVIASELIPNHTTILIKSYNKLKDYYANR